MLNREEKEEFIKDGLSLRRRKNFTQAKQNLKKKHTPSLDEYIQFLMDIQKIFPTSINSRKKTITAFNKL